MANIRTIVGYEDYSVSDDGQILNKYGKPLKQSNCRGYKYVALCKNGKPSTYSVHRLVAMYFVKGFNPIYDVHHKDGDKSNNHYSNLEWMPHYRHIAITSAKYYIFFSPTDEIIKVFNIRNFSRERGLDASSLCKVANGKLKHYKGWRKFDGCDFEVF